MSGWQPVRRVGDAEAKPNTPGGIRTRIRTEGHPVSSWLNYFDLRASQLRLKAAFIDPEDPKAIVGTVDNHDEFVEYLAHIDDVIEYANTGFLKHGWATFTASVARA